MQEDRNYFASKKGTSNLYTNQRSKIQFEDRFDYQKIFRTYKYDFHFKRKKSYVFFSEI